MKFISIVAVVSCSIFAPSARAGDPHPCPADVAPIGGNGTVDIDDLLAVTGQWGSCTSVCASCQADINCSGAVTIDDLLEILTFWGPCTTPLEWEYPVTAPTAPASQTTVNVTTPISVANLQANYINIGDNKNIVVNGQVTGVTTTLSINGKTNLTLDLTNAYSGSTSGTPITWAGSSYTTDYFINVGSGSSRIKSLA